MSRKKNKKAIEVLQRSLKIIRGGEEKERQYGPFEQSMADTATVASIMCNKEITTEDVYKVLIALKLSRLKHNSKEDTILDGITYLASFNNLKNKDNENK